MPTIKLQNNKVLIKKNRASCSCCEPPQIFLEYKYSSTYCENNCGVVSELQDGETLVENSTIGADGPCPYDTTFAIQNADGDPLNGESCTIYARFRSQDDYTVVQQETSLGSGVCEYPFEGKIEDYAIDYTATAISVNQITGLVSIDCQETIEDISGDATYPGQSRSGFFRYENKVTSCPVLFTDYAPEEWLRSVYGITISSQRSRSGNLRIIDKIIYRIPEDQIPDGYTVKIKRIIKKYGLAEGTCTGWVLTTTEEIIEDYSGEETEYNPDDTLQAIKDNEEDEADGTFAIEVTIIAYLEA